MSPINEEAEKRFSSGEVCTRSEREKEPPEVSVGDGLDQELANYGLRAKCGPWPVFINKVLLAHSYAHSLLHHLQCFHYKGRAELSSQRPSSPES